MIISVDVADKFYFIVESLFMSLTHGAQKNRMDYSK